MVEAGETYEKDGIKLKIVEVFPYISGTKRRSMLLAYKIYYKDYESPTAHIDMKMTDDINEKISETIQHFMATHKHLLGLK